MPTTVMFDANESAFDVAGESALDEAADTVTVQRGVLLQVLAVWWQHDSDIICRNFLQPV